VSLVLELVWELASFLFSASDRGRPVPHVVGLPRSDAGRLVREAGYTPFVDRPEQDPRALVVHQSPRAGARRTLDSGVRLRLAPAER